MVSCGLGEEGWGARGGCAGGVGPGRGLENQRVGRGQACPGRGQARAQACPRICSYGSVQVDRSPGTGSITLRAFGFQGTSNIP
jgi:hypothetical protein